MLLIERITTLAEFDALHPEWNDLLQRSRSDCIFLTHEWLRAWLTHLADDRKLSVLAARENGQLIGILPVALRRPQYSRMIPRRLEFLGSGVIGSDYLDVIVDSHKESEVLDAFAHHLTVQGLMLQFSQLDRSACLARQLAHTLTTRHWSLSDVRINECPFISLRGHTWDSYLSGLGSSQRYNFNRRLRSLEKTEGFRFERQTPLDVVIQLHKMRWGERGGMSEAFQTDSIVAFHREFAQLAAARGWLRLMSLWIKDRPVAALYGLRYGSKFYFYQSGFDTAYARQSVGLVMMGLSIQEAVKEGAVEYDLLHGCEEYKFHWAQERRELGRIELYPPHVRGAFYKRCIGVNRAARQLVRRMLVRRA
jgi:CelD/BcsL family acetyltransferase involved in cellulose biosynthesis